MSRRAGSWFLDGTFDPTGSAGDAAKLRVIQDAAASVTAAQQRLRQAVLTARSAGHSWSDIAGALEVSPQAARKRFAGSG